MNPVLPNLLIVGSAKCGTSSLHNYLAQHPEIFMSAKKEPRFLSSQGMEFPLGGPKDHRVEKWIVKEYNDYLELFQGKSNFNIIGESSADTLYFYKHTITSIKKYIGNPKILIVLRNPVKRSFSAYQHLVRDDRESLSFEEALQLEDDRIQKNYELIYHYRSVSRYYEPVEAFLKNFDHVKIILTEHLNKKPEQTLKSVFEFLGVDPSYKIQDFETKFNMSGKPKSRWLHEFLFEGHPIRNFIRPFVRTIVPKEKREYMSLKIQQMNLTQMKINPDTEKMLKTEFKDEIEKLERLLNISLDLWK